jgi:hypothetical protein
LTTHLETCLMHNKLSFLLYLYFPLVFNYSVWKKYGNTDLKCGSFRKILLFFCWYVCIFSSVSSVWLEDY